MTRLDPNRLTERLRHVAWIRRIHVLDSTPSTNDEARRLGNEGAGEGTIVLAERQTAGRGRHGRAWESPERLGLYLSVLLRPAEPVDGIGRYAVGAAVAVCAACRAQVGDGVGLKWPNDVIVEGLKLAGILAELRQGVSTLELILGVGVNVNQTTEDLPASLQRTATSLRIVGKGEVFDRTAVAAALLEELASTIERIRGGGWREVAGRFLRYAPDAAGRRVRLAAGDRGVTDGLDDSGALRVATAGGIVLVHASESVATEE
jgi:BirA family biotin operon repressor/biotin-[acetyl-CoA-carboxylase] ligase